MDPASAYDFHTWEIFQNVYRGLMAYSAGTTSLVPGLAESYTANARRATSSPSSCAGT